MHSSLRGREGMYFYCDDNDEGDMDTENVSDSSGYIQIGNFLVTASFSNEYLLL